MKRSNRKKPDRRALPHPNRRHPDSWRVKLRRGLRDGKGVRLTASDVEELCAILLLTPSPVTPYMRRAVSIAKIGADQPINIEYLLAAGAFRSKGIESRHRAVREMIEKEEVEKKIERMARHGSGRRRR